MTRHSQMIHRVVPHHLFAYDMAHSYVTWLLRMWPDSFIWNMTHSYVTCLIRMWHDTHEQVTRRCSSHSHMAWLRLVDSSKLYVSFAEYRLFYIAFLQKRPIILRSLLIVATPYDTTLANESGVSAQSSNGGQVWEISQHAVRDM